MCEAREPHTPVEHVRREKKTAFLASLPSLALCFILVPDLLFECSRLLEYAKIRTVLQSKEKMVKKSAITELQAPVDQKMDNTIHWINLYPVDKVIGFPMTLIRWIVIYPSFEQLGPEGQSFVTTPSISTSLWLCNLQNCKRAQSLVCHPTIIFLAVH